MMLIRPPRPILRPFIKVLWAVDQATTAASVVAKRERMLPTGMMHLAVRLSNHPVRLFENVDDANGQAIGLAVVGGARSRFFVRDISEPVTSVGAQLFPGASEFLLRVPANELTGCHTLLDDIWGTSAVIEMRERLSDGSSLERRLDVFEALLAARLPRFHGLHPAVAHALEHVLTTTEVRHVVKQTGYSHRRFIALFTRAVGLTPKLYCRVLRFQRVLERIASDPEAPLAMLALDAGYSDQSHFNRQFREFAGMTPLEYQRLSPSQINHVPFSGRNVA